MKSSMSMSRKRIVEELMRLGVYETSSMHTFSDNVLEAVLSESQKTVGEMSKDPDVSLRKNSIPDLPQGLSQSDIKILKLLANSKERLSVLALSKELDIPVTTVQRRRKKLESEFLTTNYSLKYEKFGLRKAILLTSTNCKRSSRYVGNRILNEKEVISVEIVMGENNMNIMSQVLFRENSELLDIIEKIKSFEGADQVTWLEIVEKLHTKLDAPLIVLGK
ncbi:MAG: Lrp/AsnC family transcriptional regulator [Nitrososphaera sp.]